MAGPKDKFLATQVAMTKQYEGTGRGKPFYAYKDTKKIPTIGYGINLNDPGNIEYLKKRGYNVNDLKSGRAPINPKHAEEFTTEKVGKIYDHFSKTYKGFNQLPEGSQHILVDMYYNLGPDKFAGFKKMHSAIQKKDFKTAAEELKDSKYFTDTKTRAESHYNTLMGISKAPKEPVLKPIARPVQEPSYWEEFMSGWNAPFNDPKTDYNFPSRVIGGFQELMGVTDYNRAKKQQHGGWVYPANTAYPAYGMGGRLTEEGKKVRKYGPRTYNYPDPSNVTSGPMDQRGNPNLVFGDGGFLNTQDPKLPLGYQVPFNTPSSERAMSIGGEKGEPAYLIPTFKYGKPMSKDEAYQEYLKTGEHLGGPFKTWQEAEQFGKLRHQYVEKGQNIPTPIRTWGKEYGAGGWTGYPDHTMYSSGMERFNRVKNYTKYADGGPVTWSVVEDRPMAQEGFRVQGSSPLDVPQGYFLNPGQSRVQPKIYYPSYTPGQNAAKGTAEPDYTIESFVVPMPPIYKGGKALLKAAAKEGKDVLTKRAIQNAAKNAEEKIFPIDANVISFKEMPGAAVDVAKSKQLEKYGIKTNVEFPKYQRKLDTDLIDYNNHYGTNLHVQNPNPTKADFMTGSTDVPSFNRQLNEFRKSMVHGKYPMESNIKGPFNINRPTAVGFADPRLTRFRSFEPEELGFSKNTIGPFGRTRLSPMYKEAPRFPGSETREMLPVDAMDLYRRYYVPNKQGGKVWPIVKARPMAKDGLLTSPAGMFDTGVQRADATSTAAPQVVQNTVAAKQFQSDLKNPKVTESQFKEKHGISREQYRKRPSAFDVGMNQVWEGAKVPFKLIGADPDLIRENPAEGIPQALAGTLMAELPVNEMYQAGKQSINSIRRSFTPTVESTTVKPFLNFTKESLDDAKGFLKRRQFIKQLQNEGLVGKQFNVGDLNYAARSTDKTNKLTQLALNRNATRYRGVQGEVPAGGIGYNPNTKGEFNMSRPAWGNEISEFENMAKAGVDFNDPISIAKYQATHVPMEQYGYRSGVGDYKYIDALYTGFSPTNYGNYQIRMTVPRDYSKGNYQNWFNRYYNPDNNLQNIASNKGYLRQNFIPDFSYEAPITLSKADPSVIGRKGQKMFDVDENFPFMNYKNLTPAEQAEFEVYKRKLQQDFNTGWRGQYKQGGQITWQIIN